MAITQLTPLELPNIDPQNELALVEQAIDIIYTSSGGRIDATQSGSPARVMLEAIAFLCGELLYKESRGLDAAVLELLKLAGIEQNQGSSSKVLLTFTLTQPLDSPWYLSAGYLVSDRSGTYGYTTDTDLVISPPYISGVVSATAVAPGAGYDLPAFEINKLLEERAFLAAVANLTPAAGGSGAETMDEVRSRSFAAMQKHELISIDDFADAALAILGDGAVVSVEGALAPDKVTVERGWVHIFFLKADGEKPSEKECFALKAAIARPDKILLGTQVACSPIELIGINLRTVVYLLPMADPGAIALEIHNNVKAYLSPGNVLDVGQTVVLKEIEFVVRSSGIAALEVVSRLLDGEQRFENIPMPNQWTCGYLAGVVIDAIDSTGNSFQFCFGESAALSGYLKR